MIKNTIKMLIVMSITLNAEVNMQKGIYDAAEEMIAFDKKMNRLIAEHNELTLEESETMHQNDIDIEDFEELENGYQLIYTIADANHTKVKVEVLEGMLTILIITDKKELIINGIEGGIETTVDSSKQSLFIPNDADSTSMKSTYDNGVLKILFYKNNN